VTALAIRPAETADADALCELASGLAATFVVSPAAFHTNLPLLLADPAATILVAAQGSQPIGYLLGFYRLVFYANGRVGWVEELVVAPDQRRHGVGTALVRDFERRCRERGCVQVALATRRAGAFYAALGYAESAAYLKRSLIDG
jgi:GNAT superfamily N-acetyltransferase